MAKKYIKGKDGKFQGSVPDGKSVPSSVKLPSTVEPSNPVRRPAGSEWVVTLHKEDGSTVRGIQTALYGTKAIEFFAKDNNIKYTAGFSEKKTNFERFLAQGLRKPLEEDNSVISWEEWESTYKPIRNPRSNESGIWGCMFETYGDDIRYLHDGEFDNNVYWTMVDNDPNSSYLELIPGAHMANRLGYFITQNSWSNENLTVSNNPESK